MSASEGGEASSKKSRAFVRVPLRACERCSRRKIRCNNQSPCDTCVKGGHECQMQTSLEIRRQQGQKPRRQVQTPRKKQSSLPSRENVRGESESPGSSRSKGTVILDRGHPRYIEKYVSEIKVVLSNDDG